MSETPLIKNIELFLNDKPSVYAIREQAKSLINKIIPELTITYTDAYFWYTSEKNLLDSSLPKSSTAEICHALVRILDRIETIDGIL